MSTIESISPSQKRSSSPPRKLPPGIEESNEVYQRAMKTLTEASNRFDRETGGLLLKALENRELDKKYFRHTLKTKMDCRLSVEELDSLMPHFDNNGFVDGCEFILLFYKVRFEYKSKLLTERILTEKRIKEESKLRSAKRNEEFEKKNLIKLCMNFTKEDEANALQKMADAAYRYDRLMPGAVQLDAFECESMRPDTFREQLRRIFNLQFTPGEFSAFVNCQARTEHNEVICSAFLVNFFRVGFKERSTRLRAKFDERKRINEEKEAKRIAELEELSRKNALKCSFEFTKEDERRALQKLRDAARLYDKTSSAAASMKSFEVAVMPPHVFKEQLRRLFNLEVTPAELGALMKIYDVDGDGTVSCQEFEKQFLAMGFKERETYLKDFRAKQKKAEEARKEEEKRKANALAMKNALKCTFNYSDEEYASAMHKLVEAAWRYDKTMSAAPNMEAFETLTMKPHEFKEQVKRALNIQVTPAELGAIMTFFNADEMGQINCKEFLSKFVAMGTVERRRRQVQYRKHEAEMNLVRKKREEEKLLKLEAKNMVTLGQYTEEEFQSAMSKLSGAAMKMSRVNMGSTGLEAFEPISIPPHVFKEQLKLVFNVKVTNNELAALMDYFDKEQTGELNCKEFLAQFFRTGLEERYRVRVGWREEERLKKEKDEQLEKEKAEIKSQRALREVDYDFTEADFDAGLGKFLFMCHQFDFRQLGPAGLRAFQGASLTPSEFRETMKRTFDMKLTPQELGALVTYFDPQLGGKVSCATFLNNFVQLRVKCEEFKGKANEAELLKDYHTTLKNNYKQNIQQSASAAADSKLRPWRVQSVARVMKKAKRNPPATPMAKIRLRLKSAKLSHQLDLASKACWPLPDIGLDTTSDIEQDVTEELTAIVAAVDDGAKSTGMVKDGRDEMRSNDELQSKEGLPANNSNNDDCNKKKVVPTIVSTAKYVNFVEEQTKKKLATLALPPVSKFDSQELLDRATLLAAMASSAHRHAMLSANIDRPVVDFILYSIPSEVFKMTELTTLWLTNNSITAVPASIGELKRLTVLCLSGNQLNSLPDELSELTELSRLYLRANSLQGLPNNMENLQKLTELDIASNEFSEVPASLKSLTSLTHLDVSCNKLASLPNFLEKLRNLQYLNLEQNFALTESAALVAPPVLLKLHWVSVRGCPVVLPAPDNSNNNNNNSNSAILPTVAEKAAKQFHMVEDEDEDLEMFIRSRASSRITAKLRRRKKTNKLSSTATTNRSTVTA